MDTRPTPLMMPRTRIVHTVVRPAYLDNEPVSHVHTLTPPSVVAADNRKDNSKRRRLSRNGWTNRASA